MLHVCSYLAHKAVRDGSEFLYGKLLVIIVTIPGIFVVYSSELQDLNLEY